MRYNREELSARIEWLENIVFSTTSNYTEKMRDQELVLLKQMAEILDEPESTIRSLKILRQRFKLLELLHDRKVKMHVSEESTSTISKETYKQLYSNLQNFYWFQLITTIDDLTDIINETEDTTLATV